MDRAGKFNDLRPAIWFPEAEAQILQDEPGSKLKQSLLAARKILPLPLEQIQSADPAALSDLTHKIDLPEKTKDVIPLAHTLSSRELNLVFPLLAAVATAAAPDGAAARQARAIIDRLLLIVRERASPSLYRSGWLTYQLHYPCQPLARALTILCRILEIRLQTGAIKARPGDGKLNLISRLAVPSARQFSQRLLRAMSEQGISLDMMLQEYSVLSDSALGAELTAKSLLTADAAILDGSHKLFGQALKHAPAESQISLLHHFFSLRKLPDQIHNRYCQQIYRVFGSPDSDQPIWRQLKSKDRQLFADWVRDATIGSHCRHNPEKARLYLAYSDYIRKVVHWDSNTLLIHFADFIIADSKLRPDQAISYPKTANPHPFELAGGEFNPDPTDPAIPRRPVAAAIRQSSFAGNIGLPFDPKDIRLTAIYLEMRLLGQRSRKRP